MQEENLISPQEQDAIEEKISEIAKKKMHYQMLFNYRQRLTIKFHQA